jgi:hypothetical protein
MTEQDIQDPADTPFSTIENTSGHGDHQSFEIGGCMTLESIVTITCEMEHLNTLVMLHIEKIGGFTCRESYFSIVTPILDRLESEIRSRYKSGMNHDDMKRIIAYWINQEITGMRSEQDLIERKKGSD